jgi:hypothetical protein
MRKILLQLLLLISISAASQNGQSVIYANTTDGYTLEYPAEWDSATFSPLKARFKVDFGATIKATFNDNKTGGYFTIKKSDSFGADLAIVARENEVSLKGVYQMQ